MPGFYSLSDSSCLTYARGENGELFLSDSPTRLNSITHEWWNPYVLSAQVIGLVNVGNSGVLDWTLDRVQRPGFLLRCSLSSNNNLYLIWFDGSSELRWLNSCNFVFDLACLGANVKGATEHDLVFIRKVVDQWLTGA
jgi:hypothetical protein